MSGLLLPMMILFAVGSAAVGVIALVVRNRKFVPPEPRPEPPAVPDELRPAVAALGLGEPLRCGRVYIGANPVVTTGPGLMVLYEAELVLAPAGAALVRIPLHELLSSGPSISATGWGEEGDYRVEVPSPGLCWRRVEGQEPIIIPVSELWPEAISEAVAAHWRRRAR